MEENGSSEDLNPSTLGINRFNLIVGKYTASEGPTQMVFALQPNQLNRVASAEVV